MRNKRNIPIFLCAVFFGLAAAFEIASQPTGIRQGYLVQQVHGNQAVGLAMGEFRIVAANLIWSKVVDHYDDVYDAKGGDWSKDLSLLPLLKTIEELNPHFTMAYQLEGGTILPRTGHLLQGEQVLMEGIKNNPKSWQMCQEAAILYSWTEHKPKVALLFARQGLQNANDHFSRHLMTRLCNTLEAQIKSGGAVMASDHRPAAPSARAYAGSVPQSTSS